LAKDHMHDIKARELAETWTETSGNNTLVNGIFENSPVGIFALDQGYRVVGINRAMEDFFGLKREEVIGKDGKSLVADRIKDIFEDPRTFLRRVSGSYKNNNHIENFYCHVLPSEKRQERWLEHLSIPVRAGRVEYYTDVTDLKRLEEDKTRLEVQLLQAQKMEAIGTLTGGIAHDFNNMLTPVMIHSEMALANLSEGRPERFHLEQVLKVGTRAKDMTSRILTFSRQSNQRTRPLKPAPVVKEILKLLRASLPANIKVLQDIRDESGMVLSAPIQLHRIMMNLCTNAAHAMAEKGGTLKITLVKEDLDQDSGYPDIAPGPYTALTVSDTGHGIGREYIESIFDPFFTTKEQGSGTGMGLAAVHGIVKGCGGHIMVESKKGKGASFRIFFPRVETLVSSEKAPRTRPPKGTERILIVDDQEIILVTLQLMLQSLGYQVTATTSGTEALTFFREMPYRFDLVIADHIMEKITGVELTQELISIRPGIPVILFTGYPDMIDQEKVEAAGARELLLKPIVMSDMALAIRRVLDT